MRARLTYVQGYGWHAGRLLVWPVLLLGSLVGVFPVILVETALALATGREWPWGAILPGLYAWWLWRRIRRKLDGEPFVWEPFWPDTPVTEVDLVHRHHDERRWKSLLRMELLVWGGTLVIHLVVLSWWWMEAHGR